MPCADQRGAVATGIALMLLVLATLVAIGAAQVAIGEQRSMAVEVQSRTLAGLAELELARGAAHLHFNANNLASTASGGWMSPAATRWALCSTSRVDPPCGDGQHNLYDSQWTAVTDVSEARDDTSSASARLHYLARAAAAGSPAPRREWIQIIAQALASDGRGQTLLHQDVLIHPLIAQFPEATVIAASASLGGTGRIVSSPAALSVWTAGDARLADSTFSCMPATDGTAGCGATLSTAALEGADILDVDGNQGINRDSAIAPGDIVERVFGLPSNLWTSLRDSMQNLNSCASLTASSQGAYWIDGDCSLPAGAAIGSASAPVILVVANGRLIADGNAVTGLVMLLVHDGGAAAFVPSDGASIDGALVANTAINVGSGSYVLRYDAAVGDALVNGATAPSRLDAVPGSWRDY